MSPFQDIAAKTGLAVALCLTLSLAQAQPPPSQQSAPQAGRGPGAGGLRIGGDTVDPRAQLRSYHFTNTDETLPWAVYVPTSYSKDKKTPLVLALHGMNGSHATFMRAACVDEAEKYGYILVGPVGYNGMGSFGMQFGMGGRGMRRGGPAAAAPQGSNAPAAAPQGTNDPGRGPQMDRRGPGMMGLAVGGTNEMDSAKVAQLSEIDAMNVLAMARKEFNVDESRIYLMGHSMGGGGSLHMGEAHSEIWAGVAAIAPAAFGFQWTADSKLKNVPLLIMQGEGDTLVRPEGSKQLSEQLKTLQFQCEYISLPGFDHGSIIAGSMPDVFKFLSQHSKTSAK